MAGRISTASVTTRTGSIELAGQLPGRKDTCETVGRETGADSCSLSRPHFDRWFESAKSHVRRPMRVQGHVAARGQW